MRTLILILLGLGLAWTIRWAKAGPARRRWMLVFCLVWLGVVGWNLSTGLSHGYSLSEELPIHAAILLPAWALAICLGLRK